jgi:hypothetical protein
VQRWTLWEGWPILGALAAWSEAGLHWGLWRLVHVVGSHVDKGPLHCADGSANSNTSVSSLMSPSAWCCRYSGGATLLVLQYTSMDEERGTTLQCHGWLVKGLSMT